MVSTFHVRKQRQPGIGQPLRCGGTRSCSRSRFARLSKLGVETHPLGGRGDLGGQRWGGERGMGRPSVHRPPLPSRSFLQASCLTGVTKVTDSSSDSTGLGSTGLACPQEGSLGVMGFFTGSAGLEEDPGQHPSNPQ